MIKRHLPSPPFAAVTLPNNDGVLSKKVVNETVVVMRPPIGGVAAFVPSYAGPVLAKEDMEH